MIHRVQLPVTHAERARKRFPVYLRSVWAYDPTRHRYNVYVGPIGLAWLRTDAYWNAKGGPQHTALPRYFAEAVDLTGSPLGDMVLTVW